MLTFSRVFQTRQQALEVYKSQLSGQKIYVESFESYPSGTPAILNLEIVETGQRISLDVTVSCGVGRTMAIECHYGQRAGVLLNVPIGPDRIAPLREFFTAGSPRTNASGSDVVSAGQSQIRPPESVQKSIVRPAGKSTNRYPFENIQSLEPAQALAEVDRFLDVSKTGSLYMLFNVQPAISRTELRSVYNNVVRVLHPDRYPPSFGAELRSKLSMAYQLFNDAYQVLQNSTERGVYMDVSRAMGRTTGISLETYRKWQNDYRTQNGNNIRMAEELVEKAQEMQRNGDNDGYLQTLGLALKYDPYCQTARAKLQKP